VLWSRQVADDFHARYSARTRAYRYVLINRPVRPALAARHVGWFHAPLDVDAMREAAALLCGEHDFSAFRSSECQAKSPVRTLHSLHVERSGERIDFTFRANAFLHHMVRNLVGTLVTWARASTRRPGRRRSPTRATIARSPRRRSRPKGFIWKRSNTKRIGGCLLRTRIKICGITRPSDARAAADAGADAIGLVFYPSSPRFLNVERALEIRDALPPFVQSVALFVNPDAAQVAQVIGRVHPAMLQFHGEETPDFCRQFGLPYIKACRGKAGVPALEYLRPFSGAVAWCSTVMCRNTAA
jgi:hypothetical protein